jgi:hypothetical protein
MLRPRARMLTTVLCVCLGMGTLSATDPNTLHDPVLVGAGDIADCGSQGDEATAALLQQIDGTVFTAGDNVYHSGTREQFLHCYGPSWGRYKDRTRPAAGNHDYFTAGAAPYFEYFGDRAGPAGKGYYSYSLGAWHIVVLNSNISADAASDQLAWLRDDLAKHPTRCSPRAATRITPTCATSGACCMSMASTS